MSVPKDAISRNFLNLKADLRMENTVAADVSDDLLFSSLFAK